MFFVYLVTELTGSIGDATLSKQLKPWELDLSEIVHKWCLIQIYLYSLMILISHIIIKHLHFGDNKMLLFIFIRRGTIPIDNSVFFKAMASGHHLKIRG